MLVKYLMLVLLPAVTYADISIKITLTRKGHDTSVDLSGEDLIVINDKYREIFKIDDETLKQASEKIMGKRCSDVYLKPPTPWGDVFTRHSMDIVKVNFKPVRARVVGVNLKPAAVGTTETGVVQNVVEAIEHSWSEGRELGIGPEIKYEVNFSEGSVGDSTSLSYIAPWGKESAKGRRVTLGTTSTETVPAGKSVAASLTATQGTVDIEITYSIELQGLVLCNYDIRFKGQYFYALPIRELQYAAHTPLVKYSTEKISIDFYTSSELEVSNGTSSH